MQKKKRFEIIKAFLNYNHLIKIEASNQVKRKRIIKSIEKKYKAKISDIRNGWLTSTVINKEFNKILGTHQSDYLDNRLKFYFHKKKVPQEGKRPKILYRIKKTKEVFSKIFKHFYEEKEVWFFVLSDYYKDNYRYVPFGKERWFIEYISKFENMKPKLRGNFPNYTFFQAIPHCNDIVNIRSPPSMSLFILENGFKELQQTLDELIIIQGKAIGKTVWETVFIQLEQSFWIKDYLIAPDENYHILNEEGGIDFNPKKFIEKVLEELYKINYQIISTWNQRKENEIQTY